MKTKKLSELSVGEKGIVFAVEADAVLSDQLLELGVGVGEELSFYGKSPFGDPMVIGLMNYKLAIRKAEAAKIILRDVGPNFKNEANHATDAH